MTTHVNCVHCHAQNQPAAKRCWQCGHEPSTPAENCMCDKCTGGLDAHELSKRAKKREALLSQAVPDQTQEPAIVAAEPDQAQAEHAGGHGHGHRHQAEPETPHEVHGHHKAHKGKK